MAYNKTSWVDTKGNNRGTPVNAKHLNNLEEGITQLELEKADEFYIKNGRLIARARGSVISDIELPKGADINDMISSFETTYSSNLIDHTFVKVEDIGSVSEINQAMVDIETLKEDVSENAGSIENIEETLESVIYSSDYVEDYVSVENNVFEEIDKVGVKVENVIEEVKEITEKTLPEVVSTLDTNTNKIGFLEELKLKFVYDSKCLGGNVDDTTAIQTYINDVHSNGGGKVILPCKDIIIRGLIFTPKTFTTYNKIVICGATTYGTTLIADDNSNDVFIDFAGYYDLNTDGSNLRRRQTGFVEIENIRLLCNATSKNILAINYSVTQYCDLRNVFIEGFKNGALKFTDAYDSNFYNVHIIKCGRAVNNTDYAPAIGFYGKRDCSNALHFTNCRLEFLPIFILSTVTDISKICARHIYFNNCKFEKLSSNLTNIRPIHLNYHNEFGFSDCMFVNSVSYSADEYVCDSGLHFMNLANTPSIYVTENNQLSTTKFTGCHFICPSKTFSNWGWLSNVEFENVTFNSCYGLPTGDRVFYIYDNVIMNNIKISGKGSKLFTLAGKYNDINISTLQFIDYNSEIINLIKSADSNLINIINIISPVKPSGFIRLDGNDFNVNGDTTCLYLKNNKIKLEMKGIYEFNSIKPNVEMNKEIINVLSDFVNYLKLGFDGQIVTIINRNSNVTEIVHDINYICLKSQINKRLEVNSSITLKNVAGVWYEV